MHQGLGKGVPVPHNSLSTGVSVHYQPDRLVCDSFPPNLLHMCVSMCICVSVSGLACSSDDTYLNYVNNWHAIRKCILSNEVRPGKAQHQFIFIHCAFPPCLICVLKELVPTGNSTASPHWPHFVPTMPSNLIHPQSQRLMSASFWEWAFNFCMLLSFKKPQHLS